MFKLDQQFLDEVELGDLSAAQSNAVLQQTYQTLEMRVGIVLAGRMTDTQLDEFEDFIRDKDEEGARDWLEGNFPEYREAVSDALIALKAEMIATGEPIREVLDEFLPSSSSGESSESD